MGRYKCKEEVIGKAQALGSQAKTFKGAAKFILKEAQNTTPLEKRGKPAKKNSLQGHKNSEFIRRGASIMKGLGLWALDDAVQLADEISHQLTLLAFKALRENWNYRRSRSRWAGGRHRIKIAVVHNTPSVTGGSETVWSANGKWRGTDSFAHLYVTRQALAYFPSLNVCGGWIILDARKQGEDYYEVLYVEQSRGFELKAAKGWYTNGDLFTSKRAADEESARIEAAKAKTALQA